jgi:thiamine biosynthesis lipoprotein
MGTAMVIKAFGRRARAALQMAQQEIEALEARLSVFRSTSDIAQINQAAGTAPRPIAPDTLALLNAARRFSSLAPDCFNIAIRPLTALWSHFREANQPPDRDRILRVLPLVKAQDLRLDFHHHTAFLQHPGQAVDPGGIAKGHAGDRIRTLLQGQGVASACANLGGNVITLGKKPDGTLWQVGIQHPRQEQRLAGILSSTDEAVATAGDYQRFFIDQHGCRWHHILNPADGYPAESGLLSVTIVAKSGLAADALSTLVFVAGAERGLAILKSFPQAEAILVNNRLQVLTTPGLKGRFRPDPGMDHVFIHESEYQPIIKEVTK